MNFGYKVVLLAFIDRVIDAGTYWLGRLESATRIGINSLPVAGKRLKSAGFNIYIAGNMFVCAILFSFWSKPRETISGFVGRQALMGSSTALYVAKAIDVMYPNEPAHCGETALAEDEARFVLYPEDHQVSVESMRPEPIPVKEEEE